MNKSEKSPRMRRAVARGCEKGFTLMEILVALAIIGIIVAVTAAALGGRATTTRLESVASQVAQTIQGRQQLFLNDLRDAHLTMNEVASELGTVFTNSTIVTATAGQADTSAACDSNTGSGVVLTVATLTADESEALQALIRTRVADIFTGITAADPGGYTDVFDNPTVGGAQQVTSNAITDTTADPNTAGIATVNLCFGT